MKNKKKTAKQLERYFKGVANHRRIEILRLISKIEGITVDGVCQELNANFKTIGNDLANYSHGQQTGHLCSL